MPATEVQWPPELIPGYCDTSHHYPEHKQQLHRQEVACKNWHARDVGDLKITLDIAQWSPDTPEDRTRFLIRVSNEIDRLRDLLRERDAEILRLKAELKKE